MFDWDDANEDHIWKHRITSEEAEDIFYDPDRKSFDAYNPPHEKRWGLLGQTEQGRILVVIYTYRNRPEDSQKMIRVVTAREATEDERRTYTRK